MCRLSLLSCVLLVSCQSAGDTSNPDEKSDNLGLAQSGAFVTQTIELSDECASAGDVTLHKPRLVDVVASQRGDRFEFEEGGNTYTCQRMEGNAYQCESPGASNGFIHTRPTLDVSWTADGGFAGTMTLTMDCPEAMSEADCNSIKQNLPLPCEQTRAFAASPALEEVTPKDGAYNLQVGDATRSTCKNPLPITSMQGAQLVNGEMGAFQLFDDDGGALAAFACELEEGSIAGCERRLELEGLEIHSELWAVFLSADAAEGALEVSLDCAAEDESTCMALEEQFGELPCNSIHGIRASVEGS
jgi:hypothetical protein